MYGDTIYMADIYIQSIYHLSHAYENIKDKHVRMLHDQPSVQGLVPEVNYTINYV